MSLLSLSIFSPESIGVDTATGSEAHPASIKVDTISRFWRLVKRLGIIHFEKVMS
jgi:hypothetical protein